MQLALTVTIAVLLIPTMWSLLVVINLFICRSRTCERISRGAKLYTITAISSGLSLLFIPDRMPLLAFLLNLNSGYHYPVPTLYTASLLIGLAIEACALLIILAFGLFAIRALRISDNYGATPGSCFCPTPTCVNQLVTTGATRCSECGAYLRVVERYKLTLLRESQLER